VQILVMTLSRRGFLAASAAVVGGLEARAARDVSVAPGASQPGTPGTPRPSEPWLEIDATALRHNVATIARLSDGKPVLVVAKNNAYGLGLAEVGPVFDGVRGVIGIAVVRTDEAFALRDAGVKKPVLLMGGVTASELDDLVARDVHVTPLDGALIPELSRVARRRGRPAGIHLYVDTGMHRMGVSLARVPDVLAALASDRAVRVHGVFTELTEDIEFDRAQAGRLRTVADDARRRGVSVGPLHAASSHAVWHIPDAHLDAVRPGLAVYGGYVSADARKQGELRAAYRLMAPVVRVERLDAGEGVSYHRRWVAKEPTWIATLPVGHVDGYPSGSVKGGEVLIGGRRYPVIGTVSASHTVVALGSEQTAKPGDVATLVGPDDPAVHPNEVAVRAGWSEYNMFMHLNPLLPRVVRNDR
jgi:alanine racemase